LRAHPLPPIDPVFLDLAVTMDVTQIYEDLAFVTHRNIAEDTLHQLVPVPDASDVFSLM
jgi:hypothetical protein